MRHELARRLNLRRIPELHFEPDPGGETSPSRVERAAANGRKKNVVQRKISPKLKQIVVVLFLLPLVGAAASARRRPDDMLRLESSVDAMGSTYSVAVYGEDRTRMEAAAEAAFEEVRRLDEMLSNYKPESEWSEVNRHAAERPVKVSPELFELLSACVEYSRRERRRFRYHGRAR